MAAKFKKERTKADPLPKFRINTGKDEQQLINANLVSRAVLLRAGLTSDQSSKVILSSDG